MDSDFKDINTYVFNSSSSNLSKFYRICWIINVKTGKNKLGKLINYKFDRKTKYKLSNKRLKQLEKLIQERVILLDQ